MVPGCVPFKIVSDSPTLHSRWLLFFKVMIISLWNLLQYHSIVRWAIQDQWAEPLVFFVWIAGLYTGSAKSYGSCPLDKILSNGYLANHCLCFWTTNFIHWLAVHWIISCPVDNFVQCFEQPGPGPSTKCSAPVKHVKRSGWRLLWLWH